MDNGNDRIFPPPTGQVFCKNSGPYPPQCYSTFPVLQVDEDNMTASFVFHDVPPPSDFSFFGGSTQWLANGDSHVDFCAPLSGTLVQEFDPSGSQLIWQATTPGADQFRVERLGSLYPGVQW
jgi:arylsulfate sulfotransferase